MSKKRYLVTGIAAVLLLVFAFRAYHQITGRLEEQEMSSRIIITERLHDAIESRLQGPILVSQAMARDTLLIEQLKEEDSRTEEEMVSLMRKYLGAFRESGEYAAAFLVSEGSRRYYTYEGLNKVISPETDPHDVWYSVFVDSGTPYGLDVDADEVNGQSWTVFVNGRIEDSDGRLLGACGVGVDMKDLQQLFQSYEKQYQVRVDIVNKEGLVQADSSSLNIQTTHHTDQILSDTEDYIYTEKGEDGYVVTKYIDETDWFLVVQSDGEERAKGQWILAVFLLFSFIGIAGIATFGSVGKRNRTSGGNDRVDGLTGLPNHRYFKEMYGEQGIFHTTRYKAVAVLDVDSFLDVEDNRLDKSGILRSVAECARRIMGEKGEIFYWGGDRFLILMEWSVEFSDGLCREFCRQVEKEGLVTVSVGLTEVRLSDSIKTNYYRAMQGCYLVKEMGGNGVKWK